MGNNEIDIHALLQQELGISMWHAQTDAKQKETHDSDQDSSYSNFGDIAVSEWKGQVLMNILPYSPNAYYSSLYGRYTYYTLNVKTGRPTKNSPLQTKVSTELLSHIRLSHHLSGHEYGPPCFERRLRNGSCEDVPEPKKSRMASDAKDLGNAPKLVLVGLSAKMAEFMGVTQDAKVTIHRVMTFVNAYINQHELSEVRKQGIKVDASLLALFGETDVRLTFFNLAYFVKRHCTETAAESP